MQKDLLKSLGIKIGHYTDKKNLTGVTVFIAESGATIGIDIRGSATTTFNTPAFDPKAMGAPGNAIILTGGSAYGIGTVRGVMEYLESKGIGLQTRGGTIPIPTGAVIYDIAVGRKVYPSVKEGTTAAENASYTNLQQGNIGVGTGATIGKWYKGKPMKGGFGIGITNLPHDIILAAFVVTNTFGDVVNPETGEFYSESGKQSRVAADFGKTINHLVGTMDLSGNTTLGVIATNVTLHKNQLMKIAELTHDGFARAIYPVHTNLDGDVVFAMSSTTAKRPKLPPILDMTLTDMVGLAAQEAMVKAINNSIIHATSIDGFPSYNELYS